MADLVLLCRHVDRADESALATSAQDARGTEAAEPAELVMVAAVLAETLAHAEVRVAAVRHAPTEVARLHATWLADRLRWPGEDEHFSLEVDLDLSPSHFNSWSGTDDVDGLVAALTAVLAGEPAASYDRHRAVLVVGHMPQLAWLGARLTRNRSRARALVDGYPTPLALKHGEVAAIELTGSRGGRPAGRLLWTVAPDERQAIADLREKIKSKMETAKLLGGLITLVLGGVVLDPGRVDSLSRGGDRWAVYVATVSFLIAIGLYLRTMYAYDALLMPQRYWEDAGPGARHPAWLMRRPPASAAWLLYQNMLRIWTFLFTPATAAVVVGLLALAYAALEPDLVAGAPAALALVVCAVFAARRGPVLGSQD
jgi:hypothetical protein